MSHDSSRKVEMMAMLLDGYSYQQIGTRFGISRQRVQQLISPSKPVVQAVLRRSNGRCEGCGILLQGNGHLHHVNDDSLSVDCFDSIENVKHLCASCHRRAHHGVTDLANVDTNGVPLERHFSYHVEVDLSPQDVESMRQIAKSSGKSIRRYVTEIVLAFLELNKEVK
jgi:hypothetical protein